MLSEIIPQGYDAHIWEKGGNEKCMKAIDKWNGVLPQVTGGGAIPMIGLGDTLKKIKP
jgi:hypothetical protein